MFNIWPFHKFADIINCDDFPFVYDGISHWTCITSPRSGVPKDSRWCATDANQNGAFKSVGECKTNCPESK